MIAVVDIKQKSNTGSRLELILSPALLTGRRSSNLFITSNQQLMSPPIKLTEYSHGTGCGCKIAPNMLESILHGQVEFAADEYLLVGNESKDDAAVYDIGNGEAIVSTTDFFMPIVDDPFTFGQIAATNALSDIYAMGASPMMAIAILGWPTEKLGTDVAARVVDGGRQACKDAGIILAGGHSIDAPEPIFGLAATGRIKIDHLKQNNLAKIKQKQ